MKTIRAVEARNDLPKLLDRASRGERFTIARYGRPVALLVPVETDQAQAREAVARIAEHRRHIKGVLGSAHSISSRGSPLQMTGVIDNWCFIRGA